MRNIKLDITKHNQVEIFILTLILMLYLFRTTIPMLKYPFLVLVVLYLPYFVFNYWRSILHNTLSFVIHYRLALLLGIILILSFFMTGKIYLAVFKDVINFVVLITLVYCLSLTINSQSKQISFRVTFLRLLIFFAILSSFIGIYNFLWLKGMYEAGSALVDKNFALIPVFFGILVFYFLLERRQTRNFQIGSKVLLLLFLLPILISGSRRGLMMLMIVLLTLAVIQLPFMVKKYPDIKNLLGTTIYFILVSVLITLLFYIFLFLVPYKIKNKTIEILAVENSQQHKHIFTQKAFVFSSIINKQVEYGELYERLWTSKFDPLDPESGWGSESNHSVYPLTGEGVESVPRNAIGYRMDSSSIGYHDPARKKCESYSQIKNFKLSYKDAYKVTVYCYVSDQFNGTSVSLGVPPVFLDSVILGNNSDHYDLSVRGLWKKLEIDFECIAAKARIPVFLIFSKRDAIDYSDLRGYVIFAYPQFQSLQESDELFTPEPLSPIQKNQDLFFENPKLAGMTIAKLPILLQGIDSGDEGDLIRSWTKKLIAEDTVYRGYSSDIVMSNEIDNFYQQRLNRWKFAFQVYFKEYNWHQKMIGGGFRFLNWYGYFFYQDKSRSDWPHNPFLYILLYSGLAGVVLYILFLWKAFRIYIILMNELYIFFICMVLAFFFTFFSGGNPFDPPVMGFLLLLPFLVSYIYKQLETGGGDTKGRLKILT